MTPRKRNRGRGRDRVDGLDLRDKANLRKAIRQVWSWSSAPKLVRARCGEDDGMSRCEQCFARVAKIYVDHPIPCGEVDDGFIRRMFVPSAELQGLCKRCHQLKTNRENREKRKAKA